MKTKYNIEIEQGTTGINTYTIDRISVEWDRKSFQFEDNVEIHLILKRDDQEIDVTNDYIIKLKVTQKNDTISNPGFITFNNVNVTYQKKTRLVGWKEK